MTYEAWAERWRHEHRIEWYRDHDEPHTSEAGQDWLRRKYAAEHPTELSEE